MIDLTKTNPYNNTDPRVTASHTAWLFHRRQLREARHILSDAYLYGAGPQVGMNVTQALMGGREHYARYAAGPYGDAMQAVLLGDVHCRTQMITCNL